MKKSIKMLAIMLSVLMIVSMLPTVGFASGSVTSVIDKITFNELTVGSTYSRSKTDYDNNEKAIYIYDGILNVFKASSSGDTVATVKPGSGEKPVWDKYINLVKKYDYLTLTAPSTSYSAGDKQRYSFDYLDEGNSSFTLQFGTTSDKKYVFTFGKAEIVAGSTTYTVPEAAQGKWIHIDIVKTLGDSSASTNDTFTIYVNGISVGSVDRGSRTSVADTLRFTVANTNLNIDNISITSYTNGATFTPIVPSLISGGADISKGYTGAELYVANKTVSQTIAGLGTDENVKSYSVVDANGADVAESAVAAGNKLIITDINDVVYYVPMVGNTLQKKAVINSGLSIGNVNSVASATVTTVADFYGADTAYKYEEIVGSSQSANLSVAPTSMNVPMYIRIPLFMESSNTNDVLFIAGKPDHSGSGVGGYRFVKLEKEKIYIDNGTDSTKAVSEEIGTYTKGEWFILELALFPGQSYFTVRINDGEVHTGRLGANSTYYDDFSKNEYFQLVLADGRDPWHIGAIELYTGVPTAVAAPSLNGVSAGNTYSLSDNTITVPYGKDVSECINSGNLDVSNVSTVKFIGTDGKSITSGYNGGKMVLISNDGIYKYFTLNAREKACTLMSEDAAGNKTYWVDLTTNDGSITPVIYSALFNGSLLSGVSPISIYDWELTNTTFEFTVAPHTGSTTRKIMIWDKNTLVPLAGNLN